jgi:hypothetical protein
MVDLNLPRSGLVQHQDTEDGSVRKSAMPRLARPLLILRISLLTQTESLRKKALS